MRSTAVSLRELYGLTNPSTQYLSKNSKVMRIFSTKQNWKQFSFLVKSFEPYSADTGWVVYLHYPELNRLDLHRNNRQITPMKSHVYLHCTCPSFQFNGSAYYATEMSYNLYVSEGRVPVIRDPEGDRFLCKHCLRVARYVSKAGFETLYSKFKNIKSTISTAKLSEIKPGMFDFLVRNGFSYEDSRRILDNTNFMDDLGSQSLFRKLGIDLQLNPSLL